VAQVDWMYYDEISATWAMYDGYYAHPGTLSQAVEAQLICDLGGIHGVLRELGDSYW
jgi:hypothetical protein